MNELVKTDKAIMEQICKIDDILILQKDLDDSFKNKLLLVRYTLQWVLKMISWDKQDPCEHVLQFVE